MRGRPKRPGAEPLARLSLKEAQDLAAGAFRSVGVAEEQAVGAAEILVLAEAMGISTHGLRRVADYSKRISAGGTDAAACAATRHVAPALILVDGKNGLGPAVARAALEAAMGAARSAGIGAAFVRGGSHLGALAPYLYLAAEAGFAALVTTNTAPMIAPAGGREARIGNNPIGLAIPHPDGRHVLLDMALSVVSRSRVRRAAEAGEAIPADWATDVDGHPTTDPARAMAGMMRAIGGDKGANLALMLDFLSAGLSGASMLSDVPTAAVRPDLPMNLGQAFIVIDASRLLPETDRRAGLDRAAALIAEVPGLGSADAPRLPGSRALESLRMAQQAGLDLSPDILRELRLSGGD